MARKMKDSGIEWIGEIPEGWEVGQIGQLYSERRTKVSDKDYPPLSVTMKGILPQLSTAAKTDAHDDRKLVCKGDFAINSRSDRRGSCGISEQDGSISLINTVLKPRGEMNPGYYNWLFHTSMFADEFYKWGHGIVDDLWTTGWSDMKKIGVPVPSKCEQKQLAEHLNFECSNIDTILSKTRSSIEEYKKLKQAVITQAVTEGTPAMFSSPHSVKLKYLISIVSGEAIRNEQLSDFGEYPVYGGGEIIGFCSQYNTSEGSLIIGRVGARCGCVTHTTCKSWATDNALIVLPTCNAKYMYYVIGHCQLNNLNTSNAQPLITSTKIKNVVVPYFSDAMQQQEIANYLDAKCAEIDGLIAKKEQLVKELESYKKSLIYEVVTGKREIFTDITRKFPNV